MSRITEIRKRYAELKPQLKYHNLIMQELFNISSSHAWIKHALGKVDKLYRCKGEHLIKDCKVEFIGNNHKHAYCSVCSQPENQVIIKQYLNKKRAKKSRAEPKLKHCKYHSPYQPCIEDINEYDVVPKNKHYIDWHYLYGGSNGF